MDKHYFVHESSYIDENVTIGDGTKIWHFCHVLPDTVIGQNCSFGQNCMVGPNVKIGDNVKVQNNVSIYEGLIIEDDVFWGHHVCLQMSVIQDPRLIERISMRQHFLKRGNNRSKCHGCMRDHNWKIRLYIGWSSCDKRRSRLCFYCGGARKTEGLDE